MQYNAGELERNISCAYGLGSEPHNKLCIDPGTCLHTCCGHTSYTVILKTGTKGLQKQRGEGGGSIKTTRSFAYMLSCGNK